MKPSKAITSEITAGGALAVFVILYLFNPVNGDS